LFRPSRSLPILLLAALAACGGGGGGQATLSTVTLTVQPADPTLFAGQTQLFKLTAGGRTETGVAWSVQPGAGGTFDASGNFTASATPGQYTITATLSQGAQGTASTSLTILPAPPLTGVSTDGTQAKGVGQSSSGGAEFNAAVAGEPFQSQVSTNTAGTLSVRTGFSPGGSAD